MLWGEGLCRHISAIVDTPSTVTAWFRGIPGLKIETWGTQIRWLDYKIKRSRYQGAGHSARFAGLGECFESPYRARMKATRSFFS
jgi:hypothetical protein